MVGLAHQGRDLIGFQVHGIHAQGGDLIGVGAEQVTDQTVHLTALGLDHPQSFAGGGGVLSELEELGSRGDRGDGCAQVVADLGDQRLLGGLRGRLPLARGGQLGAQQVEALRPGAEGVAPVHLQWCRQIPIGHPGCEALQFPERDQYACVDPHQQGEQQEEASRQGGCARPEEGSLMGRHRGVVAVVEEGPGHHPSIDDDGCSQRAVLAGPLHGSEPARLIDDLAVRVTALGAPLGPRGQRHRVARCINHPQLVGHAVQARLLGVGPDGRQALDGIVESRRIGAGRIARRYQAERRQACDEYGGQQGQRPAQAAHQEASNR